MMEIKGENMDEVMLPGFRFHPTDEELVGFYLKRKIQQQPLSMELIRQLDIYKYDPWDLPSKMKHMDIHFHFISTYRMYIVTVGFLVPCR